MLCISGCSDALAWAILMPGFRRPNAVTQLRLRSSSPPDGPPERGVIRAFIIIGTNTFDLYPSSTPSNPAWDTPITVNVYPSITICLPAMDGSEERRLCQKL